MSRVAISALIRIILTSVIWPECLPCNWHGVIIVMVKRLLLMSIYLYRPGRLLENLSVWYNSKHWVTQANITGGTLECCYQFEIYTRKQHQVSKHGATYDIVMRLMAPLLNQGYRLYIDNYYTSPVLLQEFYYKKTVACGTLRSNRKGVPTVIETAKLAKGDHMAMTLSGGQFAVDKVAW